MAAKKLNISVTFGNKTESFSCIHRRDFWSKIHKFYGIDSSQLQLFQITKNGKKRIEINDLQDKMKVELKAIPDALFKVNGERSASSKSESAIKVPNKNDLIVKFRENRTLTGLERQFLIKVVEEHYNKDPSNHKRKHEDSDIETFNKKVQVCLDHVKQSVQTQTDEIGEKLSKGEPSTSKDLIQKCKLLAKSDKKDVEKVRKLMDDSYYARRQFLLLHHPVLPLVKEQYPLLFSTAEVRNELNRIFYDGKDEEFLQKIEKYAETILSLVDETDSMLNTIKEKIESSVTPVQKKYVKEVGALLMISNLLHERRIFLSTEDEPYQKNKFPRIEAPCKTNKIFYDMHIYRIVVEDLLLCEASNFKEAVLCLMACFFIFNIEYPEKAFNSLVVMEKVFLEANDTDGNDIDDQTKQIIRLIQLKTNVKSLDKSC